MNQHKLIRICSSNMRTTWLSKTVNMIAATTSVTVARLREKKSREMEEVAAL